MSDTQFCVAGVETVTAVLTSGQALSVTFFFFNDTATTEIYTLSLHDALPIFAGSLSPCSATVSLTATGSAVAGSTVVTISASPLGLTTKPATFTLTVVGPIG